VTRWLGSGRATTAGSLGVAGLVGAVLVLALVVGLVVVLGRSSPAGAGGAPPRSSFSVEQARAFDEFRVFSAGPSVDGLPLTAVLRRDDTASYVSFVYGDCAAEDDAGCVPPAEVQVWPACRRSLALYERETAVTPAPERVVVRGVPAAFLDRGTRLELETGRTLVVVFARSRSQALEIAAQLEAVDGSVPPGARLPPPAPVRREGGAMGC
jgi:hypothetical protein